ncbi:LPXTG cell wall anchor domain-containing protein [Actinomyces stomatis]|uniref:LPXTG cell wall anchor domain-containing protein n=1 Tax=Actinomyces stomatis TaxID=3050227 RepID=UPI0028528B4D|nr:LPXTG cell wall anchor domain-containing protein [Actinomyces sp. PK606]
MRLGRPLAAASAVAAMTGASLIASPALANSSNRNSPSTPSSSSSPAPSSTAEATPAPSSTTQPGSAPSSTAEATPAPGKTSEGSSFKITQEKTFVSASSNTSFTVSGTGCTGKQATVGIALYAPDGTVSDVVKTEAASDGSWTSDLDLAALIKSIGTSAATTTEGWKIGAGCTTNGGKTEMAQVTTQQQTQIYFDDTRITGSYEVSARTESQAQTFTFNAQGFYASETVTVVLKSKSDSSITYTLGELTVDANGNLTGNLPAPADAANGEYLLVLTGSHHSETATSQTVTTVSNHTFTVESTEQKAAEQQTTEQKAAEQKASENNGGGNNNGGGDKQANGGGDKTTTEQQTTEQKAAEQQTTEQQTTEQKAAEQKASENNGGGNNNGGGDKQANGGGDKTTTEQQTTEQKAAEQKASENNGGGNNNGGGDKQANGGGKQAGGDNKGGTDQKVNNLNSNAKESSSDNRAGGETTKDSDRSLAHTGANGMIFGGIAAFLAVAGGAALVLRRRNKA